MKYSLLLLFIIFLIVLVIGSVVLISVLGFMVFNV